VDNPCAIVGQRGIRLLNHCLECISLFISLRFNSRPWFKLTYIYHNVWSVIVGHNLTPVKRGLFKRVSRLFITRTSHAEHRRSQS